MPNELPAVVAPARLCRMQPRDKLPAIIGRVRRQFVSRIMKWIHSNRSAYLSINYDLINTVSNVLYCFMSCAVQEKRSPVATKAYWWNIYTILCNIRFRYLVHETDFYLPVSHSDEQIFLTASVRKGGARDLKVGGGYNLRAKRAEIFFVPPAFCSLGVQLGTKHGKSSQILLRDSHANSSV